MESCKICGGGDVRVHVVPSYNADLLGAPFSVILENSVREEICASTGTKIRTVIPDLDGLIYAVTFTRVASPRKLSGADIRFIRTSMGWKSQELAKHLDLTAEHFSRCENGGKTLSSLAEKWLRLFVLVKGLEKSGNKSIDIEKIKQHVDVDKILDMKISPTWDPNEQLQFRFEHRERDEASGDSNGKWSPEELKVA